MEISSGMELSEIAVLTREIEVVQSDYIDRVQYIQNEEELDRYLWTVLRPSWWNVSICPGTV